MITNNLTITNLLVKNRYFDIKIVSTIQKKNYLKNLTRLESNKLKKAFLFFGFSA